MAEVKLTFRTRRDVGKLLRDHVTQAEMPEVLRRMGRDAELIFRETTQASGMELNREPARRRHPEAPHYIDSFRLGEPDVSDPSRSRLVFRNIHPAAHALEKGAKEHDITSTGVAGFPVSTFKGGDYATQTLPAMLYGQGVLGRESVHIQASRNRSTS